MQRYPEGSEHEYIFWLIHQQYFYEDETLLQPLEDKGWNAFTSGNHDLSRDLWLQSQQLKQELFERRWRREHILNWLSLDTELRTEGKNYPDVYEGVRQV